MNDIKTFLGQLAKYNKFYEFVLSNGEKFEIVNNISYNKLLEEYSIIKRKKSCYYNAQQLTIYSEGKYDYCEGFGVTKKVGIPLDHAWNSCNGKIIDITWDDGMEYFGMKIPYIWIKKQYFKYALEYNISDSHLWRYWRFIEDGKHINSGKLEDE